MKFSGFCSFIMPLVPSFWVDFPWSCLVPWVWASGRSYLYNRVEPVLRLLVSKKLRCVVRKYRWARTSAICRARLLSTHHPMVSVICPVISKEAPLISNLLFPTLCHVSCQGGNVVASFHLVTWKRNSSLSLVDLLAKLIPHGIHFLPSASKSTHTPTIKVIILFRRGHWWKFDPWYLICLSEHLYWGCTIHRVQSKYSINHIFIFFHSLLPKTSHSFVHVFQILKMWQIGRCSGIFQGRLFPNWLFIFLQNISSGIQYLEQSIK